MHRPVAAAVAILVAACSPHPSKQEPARTPSSTPALARFGQPFASKRGQDHPLAGLIWSPASQQPLSYRELIAQAQAADLIILGEKHDNPDHHRLQAAIFGSLLDSGRRPALALEMLETDMQPAVDQFLEAGEHDADAFAVAVKWHQSGWPDWSMYRPAVARAMEAGVPILAANVPSSEAKALMRGEPGVDAAKRYNLPPLEAEQQTSLNKELLDSHCGHLPASHIEGMSLVQRARDATMAKTMLDSPSGAVLLAGFGHARRDRGVPMAIEYLRPQAKVYAIAFLEVATGRQAPNDYAQAFEAARLPFDAVWFTPRVDDTDPCTLFRQRKPSQG